jgi:peptidoglycan hydrolase-like protein with peptidoglycan-binding domain
MRKFLYWVLLAGMVVLTFNAHAAGGAKKKSTKKTTSASAARKKSAAGKPPAVTWRNRQTQPSPERYKEIQQALANKGYLSPGQANGVWNDASADALKRFQADQNIESSGKINSLSLIALGLGPKRETPPEVKPAPAQSPEPEATPGR